MHWELVGLGSLAFVADVISMLSDLECWHRGRSISGNDRAMWQKTLCMYRCNHASLVHHQHLLYKEVTRKGKQKNWKGSWWVLIMRVMKDSSEEKATSTCRRWIKTMYCFVSDTLLKKGEVWHECPSKRPTHSLVFFFLLRIEFPLGPAVCLCDIFMCRTTVTPQPDCIVCARWVLTLSLPILSQKSCQGEVCSQAVLLQPPISQPSAFPLG